MKMKVNMKVKTIVRMKVNMKADKYSIVFAYSAFLIIFFLDF